MKRRAFLLAALCAAVAPARSAGPRFERGLLWRVAGRGAAPSHLFGTLHDASPELAELPRPVVTAFERARRLMVEFVPDADSAERFIEAALLPDGQTLEEKIGTADFAQVAEALAPAGLAREFVNRLKPWGALLNLRDAGVSGADTPDARLVAAARARNVPVSPMEDVEEQIFSFDECPMDTQVALLRHSLGHRDELLELAGRTRQAYLGRDLSAIWRLRETFIARYPEVAAHQRVMTKRLLHDRSVVMAYRMQRELRRGDAFVALGALHLFGEKGVLALLEQDGYRAVPVF